MDKHTAAPLGPADLEPELDDVLQLEAPLGVMPVRIEGPVRIQQPPTKGAGGRTWAALGTDFIRVLTADPYRSQATLLTHDQPVKIAFHRTDDPDDIMVTTWPVKVPFTTTSRTEVYVAATTGTTMFTLAQERWAQAD